MRPRYCGVFGHALLPACPPDLGVRGLRAAGLVFRAADVGGDRCERTPPRTVEGRSGTLRALAGRPARLLAAAAGAQGTPPPNRPGIARRRRADAETALGRVGALQLLVRTPVRTRPAPPGKGRA